MAATEAGKRLTEAHRLAQTRLAVDVTRQVVAAWPLLDLTDLDATTERWLRVNRTLITAAARRSSALSIAYLRSFRGVELGTTAGFSPVVALPVAEQIATSLTVTGPVLLKQATASGLLVRQAADMALAEVAGTAQRLALDGGRSSTTETLQGDERAIGWARVTSGRACSFCAMLASRGPVYRSRETASFKPSSHARCYCTQEPVYREGADWPPGSRRLSALWDEHAKGLSGKDAQNAFRRAYEAQHPDFRDARNARRRELYAQRREVSSST